MKENYDSEFSTLVVLISAVLIFASFWVGYFVGLNKTDERNQVLIEQLCESKHPNTAGFKACVKELNNKNTK